MKKLRKTFMKRDGWVEFVQVHVRTNVSDPFPEKIVRERLTRVIRLLRGESAGYSFLCNGSKPYHIGDGTTFTGFLSPFIRHIDAPVAVSGNLNDRP